jgi:antitoxin StbD
MATVAAGEGMAVAVLNRNEPAFYCVPARGYGVLMDLVYSDYGPEFITHALRRWKETCGTGRPTSSQDHNGRIGLPSRRVRADCGQSASISLSLTVSRSASGGIRAALKKSS